MITNEIANEIVRSPEIASPTDASDCAAIASEDIISIVDSNCLYSDSPIQIYCNETINKYFSKNYIVMTSNFNYFFQTFDIGCGDSSLKLNYFPGLYYIEEREAHSSDYNFCLNYHNCPMNGDIPHPYSNQNHNIKIPIKRKNIKSLIDKYTVKIDFSICKNVDDECNICLQQKKCYIFCCGKLCRECVNDKTYKKCIICKEPLNYLDS